MAGAATRTFGAPGRGPCRGPVMQADLFASGVTPESRRRPGRPRGRLGRPQPTLTCPVCGQSFSRRRRGQVYCSQRCGSGLREYHDPPTAIREVVACAHCQGSFDRPRGNGRRFCSSTCRGAHAHTLRPMRLTAYRCHRCGKIFRPDHGQARLYCSRDCAGLDRNPRPFLYHSSRRYVALARQILERDGYRCGLCRKRINPRQRAPHPLSASIDHIVPRSAGGTDALENLQAAHLRCNSHRGNRGPAQLRIGGAHVALAQ